MRSVAAILVSVAVAGTTNIALEEWRTPLTRFGTTDCRTFLPYASDPDHIWNRLQRELLVRTGPDGTLWGCDEVDPLLWSQTRHVLTGDRHRRATAALDEFLSVHADRLVTDPLKRALLQRNLWAVFQWLNGGVTFEAQREQLEQKIASIIKAVALAPEAVVRLPDNSDRDAHVSSGLELPATDRGWLLISRDDQRPAALSHAEGTPRSVFLVYLRMPAGSNADVYLETLRRFSHTHTDDRCDEHSCVVPQFPVGTEVALVRRALLVDTDAQPVVSPLIESVQIRKYFAIDPGMPVFAHRPGDQMRAELRLSQRALLQGEPSLRAVGDDESDFPAFGTQGADWFEQPRDPLVRALTTENPFGPRTQTLQSCVTCHSMPGVISFTTYSRSHAGPPGDPMFVQIHRGNEEQEIAKQLHALNRAPGWTRLQAMMRQPH